MAKSKEFLAGLEYAIEVLNITYTETVPKFRSGTVGIEYIYGIEHAVCILEDRLDGFMKGGEEDVRIESSTDSKEVS